MTDATLKDLLCFCFAAGAIMLALIVSLRLTVARLKQKNYFLNRDRERYAETLYALRDGYFAFIYPDERIKDPRRGVRERCSRRLAVVLNLKKGTLSGFADVLGVFEKEDAALIRQCVQTLRTEGLPFELRARLKKNQRALMVYGARINGADGNLYCDIVWFRDLGGEMEKIETLEAEKASLAATVAQFSDMFDNLLYPVWLRDESLKIVKVNRKFKEYAGHADLLELLQFDENNDEALRKMAKNAQTTGKMQKKSVNMVAAGGQACHFEAVEVPLKTADGRQGTVGSMVDITELDEVKRRFQIHQNAHLDVLAALGTAFALFNAERQLVFYNQAFAKMWHLEQAFLDANPSYGEFLENLRMNRQLPEVSDFKAYKSSEDKLFQSLIDPLEQLLHLPDGRTLRRIAAVHPNGLIFAYEDVSDRLAATRLVNELTSVQQNILDNLAEAVLIFGPDRRLKYFNRSYCKMWAVSAAQMQNPHSVGEVLEMQHEHFETAGDWAVLKQNMLNHILNLCTRFLADRRDGTTIEVSPAQLSDQSVMVVYQLKDK